jgi:NADH-quinone oxidoreductase subunit J
MNPPIELLGIAIGAITLLAGVMVVTSRVPIHAACFLILTLFGVAAEYVVLEAHALAVFQVLIYAGAIVVLIAFVMMLMGSSARDVEPVLLDSWRVVVGLVMAVAILGLFFFAVSTDRIAAAEHPVDPVRFGRLHELGMALLGGGERFGAGGYLLTFEIVSVLLLAGIVGAVALLRKRPAADRGEEAER